MVDREDGKHAEGREAKPWTLEWFLGLFAEVRAGEAATALLLALSVFFLLAAYYVIKPVRDSLITGLPNGAKIKSYMGAAVAVALLFAVPAYGRFASRVPRQRLLSGVGMFFVLNLLGFFAVSLAPLAPASVGDYAFALLLFLWAGIFSMMIVAQFWAFANDIYDEPTGKRLFPLIAIGQAVGGVVGSTVVSTMAKSIGTRPMFIVSAVLLAASTVLTLVVSRREEEALAHKKAAAPAPAKEPEPEKEGAEADDGPFALVFKHKYLTLIAFFTLVFTLVNTNGEYVKDELIPQLANEIGARDGLDEEEIKDVRSSMFGQFYNWVNIGTVLLQSFVVSRLVKYLGLRRAFFIMPFVALLDATAIALAPVWSVVRVAKAGENATDYSLNNTVRNMLWLPTTRRMKYLAKQATDTFFVRMGDVSSSICVLVFAQLLGFGVRAFGVINIVLIAVWLWLARSILVENSRLTEEKQRAAGEGDAKA